MISNPIIEKFEALTAEDILAASHQNLVDALNDKNRGPLIKRKISAIFSIRKDPELTKRFFRALDEHDKHESLPEESRQELEDLEKKRAEIKARREGFFVEPKVQVSLCGAQ